MVIKKINQHIKKNKTAYSIAGAVFIMFAIWMLKEGRKLIVDIPTQSLLGGSIVGLNIGIVLAVAGGIIWLLSEVKDEAGYQIAGNVLAPILIIGGIILSGSSLLAAIAGFFQEMGTIGMLVVGGIVFLIISMKLKRR